MRMLIIFLSYNISEKGLCWFDKCFFLTASTYSLNLMHNHLNYFYCYIFCRFVFLNSDKFLFFYFLFLYLSLADIFTTLVKEIHFVVNTFHALPEVVVSVARIGKNQHSLHMPLIHY